MFQAFKQHTRVQKPSQFDIHLRKIRTSPFEQRLNISTRKARFVHFETSPRFSSKGRFHHYRANHQFQNQKSPIRPKNQYYQNEHHFQNQMQLNVPSELTSHQLKSGPSDPSTENSWNSRKKEPKPQFQIFSHIIKRLKSEQETKIMPNLIKSKTEQYTNPTNYFQQGAFEPARSTQRLKKYQKDYPEQRERYQQMQTKLDRAAYYFKQLNVASEKKSYQRRQQNRMAIETEYGDIGFLQQDLHRAYNKFEGNNGILKSIQIESTPNKVNELTMDPTF